jgi:rod shape determining protein RodA
MVTKRDLYYFDFVQFLLILCLLLFSIIFVYSATYSATVPYSIFFKKQCGGILIGIVLYCIACIINHQLFIKTAQPAYFIVLFLLAFTLFKGSIGMGAQRWIDLGIFKFQPSELTKILFPSFVVLSFAEQEQRSLFNIVQIIGILLISFILIAKQPDLGTALVLLFSTTILLGLCKVLTNKFFIGVAFFLLLITPLLWRSLKPYQQQRIAVFLGYGDIQKEAYQREQALIAIGSGGLLGKGFLQGSQNKLQFLPEGRTDFIFAVICEEWGLLGALLIIGIYSILFYRFYTRIIRLTNKTAQLLALGMIIHIVLSMIINCAMVLGMLPIVGIPLPLLSYGVTHLWITLISLGIFQNITMNRLYRND